MQEKGKIRFKEIIQKKTLKDFQIELLLSSGNCCLVPMAFALNPKDFESHEFPKVLRLFVNFNSFDSTGFISNPSSQIFWSSILILIEVSFYFCTIHDVRGTVEWLPRKCDISFHSLLLSLEIYTNSKFFYGKDLIVSTRNFLSLSTSWS